MTPDPSAAERRAHNIRRFAICCARRNNAELLQATLSTPENGIDADFARELLHLYAATRDAIRAGDKPVTGF
jgi:hypothetical protein